MTAVETDAFVAHDTAFASVTGERASRAKLGDVDAHEGPVFLDGSLFFTSLPRRDAGGNPDVAIRRLLLDTLEVVTVREHANAANGMTPAADGHLLVCEQGT